MAKNRHVSHDQLLDDIAAGAIDTVLAVFPDHTGRLIGKRTDGEFYAEVVAHHGTENCDYLLACDLDNTPIPGFDWASYEQGYGDMRGVVDLATVRYLPWLEKTALVMVDLVDVDSGAPVEVSARRMLQVQVDKAAAAGFVPMIGSEIEFVVFKDSYDDAHAAGYRDLTPNSPWVEDYAILQTTKEEDLLGALRRALAGAGMPVEFSKGEAGRGQHEINLTYQTAVEMADINAVFKGAVKEVAHQHGKSATFMAKPHFDDAGSSGHIHSSLWSPDGESLMAGDGPHHMSDTFRWYLGGLLATAREFSLLFAPTVNSYKRFQLGSWAPTGIGWDVDNRTLGFRVVGHGSGLRVENRIPGADVNSHHAFAATLAGGLYGIANQVEPGEPFTGDGYRAADLPRIPATMPEAIALWRDSQLAVECFGADVHRHVLVHAEYEWSAFNRSVTDWERARYFERI
ncbi:MAG TPA: glutamine synthetase family protein [Ilumatobacter sp.]|nr:glutamine synthetase family protein [Ilumatobacter sp.]